MNKRLVLAAVAATTLLGGLPAHATTATGVLRGERSYRYPLTDQVTPNSETYTATGHGSITDETTGVGYTGPMSLRYVANGLFSNSFSDAQGDGWLEGNDSAGSSISVSPPCTITHTSSGPYDTITARCRITITTPYATVTVDACVRVTTYLNIQGLPPYPAPWATISPC